MWKWKFDSKYSFGDENFARIYRFYVIETPVEGVSVRGTTFKEKKVSMNSFCNVLKKKTPFLKDYWISTPIKDMVDICKKNNIYESVTSNKEIVIHTNNSLHCSGKTDSLFYAIRCALAHGSFSIRKCKGEKYYLLENCDKGKLKARMIIKETTLLTWINEVNKVL